MITLKTLPEATTQEVFDQVVNHLRSQNKHSEDDDRCLYRDKNGLKCAAGCLIADDEYDKKFEQTTWDELCEYGLVPKNHQELIRCLQVVHDGYQIDDWESNLQRVADKFNLNYKR